MNIGIIGYGRMGKIVEKVAIENKHKISDIFDIDKAFSGTCNLNTDVLIDFSIPSCALNNIEHALNSGINIVSGTTGFDLAELKKLQSTFAFKSAVLFSPNFSLGLNVFLKLCKDASKLLSNFDYDAYLEEYHHDKKLDAPSGTAKKIESILLENFSKKNETLYDNPKGQIKQNTLQVKAIRSKSIPGIHKLTFQSDRDNIEIKHSVFDRSLFAEGAIKGAEWLKDKKGVFFMEDFLESFI
ncbi:MAG: 4-hydroxy-tetrahydrodipicolinate reductase [Pseudomonadota bacterium]